MVETLSELLENAANVAEDNGGKLSIASAAVLIAEAYESKKYKSALGPEKKDFVDTYCDYVL